MQSVALHATPCCSAAKRPLTWKPAKRMQNRRGGTPCSSGVPAACSASTVLAMAVPWEKPT